MPRFIDLNGKTYGSWTVLERTGVDSSGNYLWLCHCECGKEAKVSGKSLRYGLSRSCGCSKGKSRINNLIEFSNPVRKKRVNTPEQKERKRLYDRQYNIDNAKMKAAQKKRYALAHVEQKINYHYLYKYGITLVDYNKMFEEQGGCCAACGEYQSKFKRSLAVDHDHKTGKIRGLLCKNCNAALGNVRDNINTLDGLIKYLLKN
jgi:hypothetical protein